MGPSSARSHGGSRGRLGRGSTASPWRYTDTGRRVAGQAVRIPLDMQLKFQLCYEFDFLVPQIQFIVSVLEISVCHRDRNAQCQTVQGTVKTSQVQFLGG